MAVHGDLNFWSESQRAVGAKKNYVLCSETVKIDLICTESIAYGLRLVTFSQFMCGF